MSDGPPEPQTKEANTQSSFQYLREIRKAIPFAPLYLLGLFVHVPYLASLGATTLPGTELSTQGQISTLFFVAYTYLTGSVGFLVAKSKQLLVRVIWAVLLSGIATWSHFHSKGPDSLAPITIWCAVGWLTSSFLTGTLLQWSWHTLENWKFRDAASNLRGALSCAAIALPFSYSAFLYSTSILPNLPFYFGGLPPRVLVFQAKEPVPPIKTVEGRTEPIRVVYEDKDHYWIQHLMPPNDDRWVMLTIDKSRLGFAEESSSQPQSIAARQKQWEITIPKEAIYGG